LPGPALRLQVDGWRFQGEDQHLWEEEYEGQDAEEGQLLMNVSFAPLGLGTLIALLVLIVVLVLAVIGSITPLLAGLIGGLALARLC